MLTSWYEKMVEPFVVGGEITSAHENQSLPGLSVRLLTHRPSWVVFKDSKSEPELRCDNLFDLDPRVPRGIVKGAMLIFAALVVWRCRTPLTAQAGWRLCAEFALIVLGMLLFSERTWKHHCVTLMLPFGVLLPGDLPPSGLAAQLPHRQPRRRVCAHRPDTVGTG